MTEEDFDHDQDEIHDDPKCDECGQVMKWDGEQWKCNCLNEEEENDA